VMSIVEKTSEYVKGASEASQKTSSAIERMETGCRESQVELAEGIKETLYEVQECLMANVPVDDGHGSTYSVSKNLAQILVDNLDKQAKKDEKILNAILDQNRFLKYLTVLVTLATLISAIIK